METTMRQDIENVIKNFKANSLQLDNQKFLEAVFDSFKQASIRKHYVLVVPIDLNDYSTSEVLSEYNSNGFYRPMELSARFNNQFYIPYESISEAKDILEYEEMKVEEVRNIEDDRIVYVITMDGKDNSKFIEDFSKKN